MITIENLTNNELLEHIENCTLPTNLFTHEVQLKLSWILIRKYGLKYALVKAPKIKEQYYKKALQSNAFDSTLSKAYTEILYHFMKKSTTNNFDKLLREFPRLKYSFKGLLKTHYGYNILEQEEVSEKKYINKPILFTF